MPAETRFAERTKEIFQRFVAQKIERLVSNFEPRLPIPALAALRLAVLRLLIDRNMTFLRELLKQIFEQLIQLLGRHGRELFEHLLHLIVWKKLTAFQRLLDRPLQVLERVLVPLRERHILRVETALEEEIGQSLHQIIRVDPEVFSAV